MAKTDEAKSVEEFFCSAPEANSVQLVGDFTNWQSKPVNLVKQANGVWKTTVALAAGTYHYRFLVDGQWCDDPQCTLLSAERLRGKGVMQRHPGAHASRLKRIGRGLQRLGK